MIRLGLILASLCALFLSGTRYEYDTRGRLAMMRMHLPDAVDTEVVMTVFFYKDGARDPEKTEVTSYIENKVRTIP